MKTRFYVDPKLVEFSNKYIKDNIGEDAVLQGARFMHSENEIRIWWLIPKSKNRNEFWGCKLMSYYTN